MKRSTLITSAGAFLLALTARVPQAQAQPGGTGVAFEIRATSSRPGGQISSTERFVSSGTRVRMELTSGALDSTTAGVYTIVNATDSTITSVMPKLRMVMIMRIPRNMNAVLGAEETMAVSDVTKSRIEDLGPGERLLGRDTHHYRITRAATLTMTLGGRSCSVKKDQTEDAWIATDPAASAAIRSAERQVASLFGATPSAGQSWSDVFDRVAPNRPPRGIVLRSVTRSHISGPDAKPDSSVYTREYTMLSLAPVDTTVFATPAGFTVQDMRALQGPDGVMANMMRSGGLDSLGGCPDR